MPATSPARDVLDLTEDGHVKRRRTSKSPERDAVVACADINETRPSTKHLTFVAIEKEKTHTCGRSTCGDTTRILVPQQILQTIPFYKSELESALSTTNPNEIPTIKNAKIPSAGEKAFVKTINLLGGAPLPVIDTPGCEEIETLTSLLAVYDTCIQLQTEELERAVLDHMANYEYLKLKTFTDFAREVYGDTGSKKRAVDSSIGKVIKLKLTALFQRLLQEGEEKRIIALGGVLGTELLEVIVKYYSGVANMKFEQN